MSAAAAGTGLSWTSPVKGNMVPKNESVVLTNTPFTATDAEFTWIASLLAIGAICGAVPSGIFADKIGRKKAAILITIPYILSWLTTVFAQNVPMLYAARFLIGECLRACNI